MVNCLGAYQGSEGLAGYSLPFGVSFLYKKVDVSWVANWVYRDPNCFGHPRQSWNDVDLLLGRLKQLVRKQPWLQTRPLSTYADGLQDHRSWLWSLRQGQRGAGHRVRSLRERSGRPGNQHQVLASFAKQCERDGDVYRSRARRSEASFEGSSEAAQDHKRENGGNTYLNQILSFWFLDKRL